MSTSDLLLVVACRGYWRLPAVVGGSHAGDILINSKTCWAKGSYELHEYSKKKLGKLTESCTMAKASDNFQHAVIEVKRYSNFIEKITYFVKTIQWLIYEHKLKW